MKEVATATETVACLLKKEGTRQDLWSGVVFWGAIRAVSDLFANVRSVTLPTRVGRIGIVASLRTEGPAFKDVR